MNSWLYLRDWGQTQKLCRMFCYVRHAEVGKQFYMKYSNITVSNICNACTLTGEVVTTCVKGAGAIPEMEQLRDGLKQKSHPTKLCMLVDSLINRTTSGTSSNVMTSIIRWSF